MKKILSFAIIAFLAACSSSNDKATEKKEVIVKTPVTVTKLQNMEFNHFFKVSGTVEAINSAFISPEISGQIKNIYVEEGERVMKGQILAKLNTSLTDNGINELKTSLELAKTIYKKQKQLWDKEIGSEIQFLEAKHNKESLENKLKTLYAQQEMAIIKAPINGIVDEIFLKEGELGIPGMQIMQIVNLNDLYINADVAESHIADIKTGDEVVLSFSAFPEMEMKVPVFRTGNIINPANRTFKVQLKIKNQNEKLKPNLISLILINDFSVESVLVVPSEIIKQDINGSYLYVIEKIDNKNIARKKYIKTGMSYKEKTMIAEGVKAGEMVVTKGYAQVSAGVEVSIVNN
ncbi:MAG: efflux RND transporter periplasmic adaptor subunit [Bacteroidales bacterium]|nr:efflux RND transporter periplasmic adaptor subunit [Bacteroidales bacterium]